MGIEQNKTVSVIMPCYNDGKYIEEAIQSVKNQTYPDIELIIINDGSNDKYTLKVLDKIRSKGICVLDIKNIGPSGARNMGIRHAKGSYILPLDSDDTIEPAYIEKAVHILVSDANIGGVYCQADFFGKRTGKWRLPPYSLEEMLIRNVIFVTTLFRKADWDKTGGFDESFIYGFEDYDFWLSIIELGKTFHQIPEVLFHYRIKDASRTEGFISNPEHVKLIYEKIYSKHKRLYLDQIDIYTRALRKNLLDYQIKVSKIYQFMLADKLRRSLFRIAHGIYKKLFHD